MLHTVSCRGVAAARSTRSTGASLSSARPSRLSRTRVATTEAKTKEEKKGACLSVSSTLSDRAMRIGSEREREREREKSVEKRRA
jgi:hypothetical protein